MDIMLDKLYVAYNESLQKYLKLQNKTWCLTSSRADASEKSAQKLQNVILHDNGIRSQNGSWKLLLACGENGDEDGGTIEIDECEDESGHCMGAIDTPEDILNALRAFYDVFNSESYKSLHLQLSALDKEVSDIYHMIEFGRFSASKGYECYKMLHETLQKRRCVKNKIRIYSSIMDRNIPVTSQEFLRLMEPNHIYHYTPRVRSDLFN